MEASWCPISMSLARQNAALGTKQLLAILCQFL